jgi:peptide/nickel transport system substrate-binding protein
MGLRHRFRAAIAAFLMISAVASCSQSGNPSAEGVDEVLRIGSMVEPITFDPAGAGTGPLMPYAQAVYDTLTVLDDEGQPAPGLASSYDWDEDRLKLTLGLQEGVVFSDGAPFNAEAVRANVRHFQESAGQAGPVLRLVDSVDTPDEHTVVFNLSAPDPSLPYSLAGPAGLMGSPEMLGTDAIARDPVGTGPYRLDVDRTVSGSEYVYVRNEDYWAGEVPYSELRILVLADETARTNALTSGQVDAAQLRQPQYALDAQNAGLTLQEVHGVWEGLFFLDRDGELKSELADPRVRTALRIAIDAEAIIDNVLSGYGEVTSQIFPPYSDAYVDQLDSYYTYDPERARELLAEAGYSDGLSIPFPRANTVQGEIYTAIEQYWSEIGVTTEPHQWAQGEPIPSIQAGDFPLVYFANIMHDSWSTVNFSVAPKARYNPFNSTSGEVESLLADMQTGSDQERTHAGQEMNRYLVEQAWFGPIMRPTHFYLTNSGTDAIVTPGYVVPPPLAHTPGG